MRPSSIDSDFGASMVGLAGIGEFGLTMSGFAGSSAVLDSMVDEPIATDSGRDVKFCVQSFVR